MSGSHDEPVGNSLPPDVPIDKPADDSLGRAPLSAAFAREILELDASRGVVVGVLGEWGAGKTSFLNLTCRDLKSAGVTVLEFNPWMFSGADQLVERFFVEMAAQLRLRKGFEDIAESMASYGETVAGLGWLPLVGPWLERLHAMSKLMGRIGKRRRQGVLLQRERLSRALADLDRPVVITVDDIDRLTTQEIRDIFRLVRLTGNFPNLIYFLAFDRARVEEALAEERVPGREYLEKILQLALDLPAVPEDLLRREFLAAIEKALANLENTGPFHAETWPDLFTEVVWPFIRHMRDVNRFALALRGTVRSLDGQIALADVIALEAIRVFQPELFASLNKAVEGLTTTSSSFGGGRDEPPRLKEAVDRVLEAAGAHDAVAKAMIERLFPAAVRHIGGSHYGPDWESKWLRRRRVAQKDVLKLFLERTTGVELGAFTAAEAAFSLMSDAEALRGFLEEQDPERLEDIIASLENFEEDFSGEHVIPGAATLLNLLPLIPDRQRGMFEYDTRMVVGRVVYRLVRKLANPEAVEEAVDRILPLVDSLSGKLQLINMVGHKENVGHKLIREHAAAELERRWRTHVREAGVEVLLREHDLLYGLLQARRGLTPGEAGIEIPWTPELVAKVIEDAQTEVKSQPMGSRAMQRSARIKWDALLEVFGSEGELERHIDMISEETKAANPELYSLVVKYLSGWRPQDL